MNVINKKSKHKTIMNTIRFEKPRKKVDIISSNRFIIQRYINFYINKKNYKKNTANALRLFPHYFRHYSTTFHSVKNNEVNTVTILTVSVGTIYIK